MPMFEVRFLWAGSRYWSLSTYGPLLALNRRGVSGALFTGLGLQADIEFWCDLRRANAINWTRLSRRSFAANAVRLRLHALAYNLGNFLRTLAIPNQSITGRRPA